MLRGFYSLSFYLATPFILCYLFWRSIKAPSYRQRIGERFGFLPLPPKKGGIWIHTVSLGEFLASIPLVKRIQQQYPDKQIIITTMTPTGSERVKAVFGNEVYHVYTPYDMPCVVKRFLKLTEPKLAIIMETELWPNVLHYCREQQVPVFLANGRLSERSAAGYRKIFGIAREMMENFTMIAAQTQVEAERFISLGLAEQKAVVTGSIKFDVNIPASIHEKAQSLRREFDDRPIWIAASTHDGEDELVLQAHEQVLKQIPEALLILVPRHPERFAAVNALCQKKGYRTVLRSRSERCTRETDVFVGDTMGELPLFYATADVSFVGGSLVPVGGHNLLEPAALGKPSITGRYIHNFLEINRLLGEVGARIVVDDVAELADSVVQLLTDNDLRVQMGERGLQVVNQNRGALDKHLELIATLLS